MVRFEVMICSPDGSSGTRLENGDRHGTSCHPGFSGKATRTFEEAEDIMGAVVPLLIIVTFWAIVFFFAFGSFRRWLKEPTEPELEMRNEHADSHEKAEEPVAH
jgi:hypothetical protein